MKCGTKAHIHVLLSTYIMTFAFLALPLFRMAIWLKGRPAAARFPVELSQTQ